MNWWTLSTAAVTHCTMPAGKLGQEHFLSIRKMCKDYGSLTGYLKWKRKKMEMIIVQNFTCNGCSLFKFQQFKGFKRKEWKITRSYFSLQHIFLLQAYFNIGLWKEKAPNAAQEGLVNLWAGSRNKSRAHFTPTAHIPAVLLELASGFRYCPAWCSGSWCHIVKLST